MVETRKEGSENERDARVVYDGTLHRAAGGEEKNVEKEKGQERSGNELDFLSLPSYIGVNVAESEKLGSSAITARQAHKYADISGDSRGKRSGGSLRCLLNRNFQNYHRWERSRLPGSDMG